MCTNIVLLVINLGFFFQYYLVHNIANVNINIYNNNNNN